MSTPRFCPIPAGTLTPGLDDDERQALQVFLPGQDFAAEAPRAAVDVDAFALSETPVTRGQFRAFVVDGGYANPQWWAADQQLLDHVGGQAALVTQAQTAGPRTWRTPLGDDEDDDLPVDGVSWFEARAFARFSDARLPTAVEWEWAARGPERRTFPWSSTLTMLDVVRSGHLDDGCVQQQRPQAHFSSPTLTAVGAVKRTSPFGVLDLAGNVAEWTSTAVDGNLPGLELRVLCGDVHRAPLPRMHGAAKAVHEAHRRLPGFGFRLARSSG